MRKKQTQSRHPEKDWSQSKKNQKKEKEIALPNEVKYNIRKYMRKLGDKSKS